MDRNIPVIHVEQFQRIVRLQFLEKNYRPIFGLGKGGIGKTESIKSLTEELQIGHIDIRLLTYSEVDLKGIPYPNVEHTRSIWLQNDVLPRVERDGEKGILVLDEITSVSRSVRTAAYQLLNERRLGDYVLPEGWMIVCLGNGEEDGGDFQGMEGNFVNRCSIFRVEPDVKIWKQWAAAHGIHELVLAYISWRSDELHTFHPDSETELAFASPRSWTAVSHILNQYGYDEMDQITHLRILSNVGIRTGEQFWSFCRYRSETVDPEEILSGRVSPDAAQRGEILFLTMEGVISLLTERIQGAPSHLSEVEDELIFHNCVNGIRWILGLKNLENTVMGLKELAGRNLAAMTRIFLDHRFQLACPELIQFANENEWVFQNERS